MITVNCMIMMLWWSSASLSFSVNIYGSNERVTEDNDHISNFNKSINNNNNHRNQFLKNLVNVRQITCAVANIVTAFAAATPLSLIDSLSNTMDHGYVRRRLPSTDHTLAHMSQKLCVHMQHMSVSSNVRCKNVFKLNFIRHRRDPTLGKLKLA